jgi:hypothetical protein
MYSPAQAKAAAVGAAYHVIVRTRVVCLSVSPPRVRSLYISCLTTTQFSAAQRFPHVQSSPSISPRPFTHSLCPLSFCTPTAVMFFVQPPLSMSIDIAPRASSRCFPPLRLCFVLFFFSFFDSLFFYSIPFHPIPPKYSLFIRVIFIT